jgi:hypothetical protein
VSLVLGQKARPPVVVTGLGGSETCTYPGTSRIPSLRTVITFYPRSASEFAYFETFAIAHTRGIEKVPGLGKGAWMSEGPDLHVFDGHEEIEVTAANFSLFRPATAGAIAKVENLARVLL